LRRAYNGIFKALKWAVAEVVVLAVLGVGVAYHLAARHAPGRRGESRIGVRTAAAVGAYTGH
jgi:hypothetical protein